MLEVDRIMEAYFCVNEIGFYANRDDYPLDDWFIPGDFTHHTDFNKRLNYKMVKDYRRF